MHGGATKASRRKGQRVLAQQEIERLLGSKTRDIDPADALMELVQEAAGNVELLREKLHTLQTSKRVSDRHQSFGSDDRPVSDRESRITAATIAYDAERDRLGRYSKLAHDAGIETRRLELAEAQAERLAMMLLAALADPEWKLDAKMQEAGRRVIGRHMRAIAPGAKEVIEA